MPFDANLAERLQSLVEREFAETCGLEITRMFGGFGYLLHGNMCIGIHNDSLIVRVGPEVSEQILQEAHVRPMDLTGRVMKGWATIEPEGHRGDEALARYCQLAISFVGGLPPKGRGAT